MKAVVIGDRETARVVEVAEPHLQGPGDAIVRVTATAICGAITERPEKRTGAR